MDVSPKILPLSIGKMCVNNPMIIFMNVCSLLILIFQNETIRRTGEQCQPECYNLNKRVKSLNGSTHLFHDFQVCFVVCVFVWSVN